MRVEILISSKEFQKLINSKEFQEKLEKAEVKQIENKTVLDRMYKELTGIVATRDIKLLKTKPITVHPGQLGDVDVDVETLCSAFNEVFNKNKQPFKAEVVNVAIIGKCVHIWRIEENRHGDNRLRKIYRS